MTEERHADFLSRLMIKKEEFATIEALADFLSSFAESGIYSSANLPDPLKKGLDECISKDVLLPKNVTHSLLFVRGKFSAYSRNKNPEYLASIVDSLDQFSADIEQFAKLSPQNRKICEDTKTATGILVIAAEILKNRLSDIRSNPELPGFSALMR